MVRVRFWVKIRFSVWFCLPVLHTYLYYFPLSLSLSLITLTTCRESFIESGTDRRLRSPDQSPLPRCIVIVLTGWVRADCTWTAQRRRTDQLHGSTSDVVVVLCHSSPCHSRDFAANIRCCRPVRTPFRLQVSPVAALLLRCPPLCCSEEPLTVTLFTESPFLDFIWGEQLLNRANIKSFHNIPSLRWC